MVEKLKKVNKTFKGWKTIAFNSLAMSPVALDILGYVLSYPSIQNIIPEGYMDEYTLGIGVVNLILRYMTTTPVGQKY